MKKNYLEPLVIVQTIKLQGMIAASTGEGDPGATPLVKEDIVFEDFDNFFE